MENREGYFAKKYFKDNWLQIIIGYIVSVVIAFALCYIFQVEDKRIILTIVIAVNFLSDLVSFIKYMSKSTKLKN